ncbi:RNA polymerase sigma factor [Streptomyces niveus]|uniref:RNA polymerase sigma factor n=1 Tax=Streptomyces niveus TaxID=193462 RepID=UPI00368169ED
MPDEVRLASDAEFSSFYRGTIRELTGFLINQGAALPVAADIAQDTMTKAYRRWTDIRQPRAWVHTVASRALIRRIADLREDPVGQLPEPTSLLAVTDPVTEWETQYDALRLLTVLPPRQRQVLAWTLNGFTPSEIAEHLGLTAEAVRASLKKARRTAAAHLRNRGELQ